MTTQDEQQQRFARALGGDAGEIERLLREIEPELRSGLSIQPIWRRSLDPDDVLQVSYLEAFLRFSALKDATRAGFRAWMRRLVENNLRDAIRALERDKRPNAHRRQTMAAGGGSARTLLQSIVGEEATGGGEASTREQLGILREAVGRLPASYRQVVEQVDLAERPVADVADEMGRSRGAVHLLRSRAHDRLQELLRSS